MTNFEDKEIQEEILNDQETGYEAEEEALRKYTIAPEIRENYVVPIINNHRQDLAMAAIITMFRKGKWASKQRDTWAQAKKVSQEMQAVTGPVDFLIVVNEDIWEKITEDQRIALIDHELCHCRRGDDDKHGNPKWEMVGHDVEEFYSVIRRYGVWSEELRRTLKAFEESKQVVMFDSLKAQQEEEERAKDFDAVFGNASNQ